MARRLASILSADICDYSRYMNQDEADALSKLNRFKRTVLKPEIERHEGRIAKDMGDGWLVEFSSSSSAVTAALQMLKKLESQTFPQLRIGIHSGDIVHQDGDVFGDGVNIAARLQEKSLPGGVLVSEFVHQSLNSEVAHEFQRLGDIRLKNIADPITVFGAVASSKLELVAPDANQTTLPDKPTVAVLPLASLSSDPENELMADALTENLITMLSSAPNLYVIARNSSFVFKGKPSTTREVSEALGARYIVEGSIQVQGNRVRIAVQLIDAETDRHMWAELYDRTLEDIFDLQDEIAHKVGVELHVKLTYGEHVRNRVPDVESLKLFTVGRTHFNEFTAQGLDIARKNWTLLFEKDQSNPEGLCLMGWLSWHRVFLRLTEDAVADLNSAREFGEKALGIDPNYGNAHRLLGVTAWLAQDFAAANQCIDRALELQPSDGEASSIGGAVRMYSGFYKFAEERLMTSLKLEPYSPTWVHQVLATCRLLLGKTDLAKSGFRQIAEGEDEAFVKVALFWLIAIAVEEENQHKADELKTKLLSRFPNSSVAQFEEEWVQIFEDPTPLEKYVKNLETVGLPLS